MTAFLGPRRASFYYAYVLKDLADIHFPRVKTILLVQDNLNIHSTASLYEAFPRAEARRLVERFSTQCLDPPHSQQTGPNRGSRRSGGGAQCGATNDNRQKRQSAHALATVL